MKLGESKTNRQKGCEVKAIILLNENKILHDTVEPRQLEPL